MTAIIRIDVSPMPWADQAACRGVNPELFFPAQHTPSGEAKAVCATCPVATECLDYALDNREVFGVWGGTSEKQRRLIRRDRRRTAAPVSHNRSMLESNT